MSTNPAGAGEGSLHDYVVNQLQAAKGTWPKIIEETGIARGTLVKIAMRHSKDPSVSFIERLARYFREKQAEKEAQGAA